MFNSSTVWAFFPYPDYLTLFKMALFDLPEYYRSEETLGWWGELTTYCHFSLNEVSLVCVMAVLWIFLRLFFTHTVFLPIGRWAGLTKANCAKFPESAWRCLFKAASWSLAAYVLFGYHFEVFADPPTHFKGWYPGKPVSPDIQLIYIIDGSFFLHCMFATLFLDVWRKDSIMMCIHHVVTLALIGLSYGARYTTTGLMVMFCHDFSDIFLDFAKCIVYTKVRFGKSHMLNERLADVAFGLFFISWIVMRLYWFPLKTLYSILPRTAKIYYQGHLPFGVEFNIMLWAIMALDIYWFCIISNILIKILTGQMAEMGDIREEQEEDEFPREEESEKKLIRGAVGQETPVHGEHPVDNATKLDSPLINGSDLKRRTVAAAVSQD